MQKIKPNYDVLIIGGGASGVIAAYHVLKETHLKVGIIEPAKALGLGQAYAAPYDWLVLNVPATKMIIDVNAPDAFFEWAKAQASLKKLFNKKDPGYSFLPRSAFAKFLQDSIKPYLKTDRLTWIRADAKNIQKTKKIFQVKTNKKTITAKTVFLCTGLAKPRVLKPTQKLKSSVFMANPWNYTDAKKFIGKKYIAILGTGLTMIDTVLSLKYLGFKGKIIALSRHGLIPRPHAAKPIAAQTINQLPTKDLLGSLQYIRKISAKNFIPVIDGLRPHVQTLWQTLTLKQQRQFFRHLATFWDVHRHRIAPQPAALIQKLIRAKKLLIIKGRVKAVVHKRNKLYLTTSQNKSILVDAVINCLGPGAITDMPLIKKLIKNKIVRMDKLGLGLDVTKNSESVCCPQLIIIGQLARGTRLEITAVPEIAKQITAAAKRL